MQIFYLLIQPPIHPSMPLDIDEMHGKSRNENRHRTTNKTTLQHWSYIGLQSRRRENHQIGKK